MLEIYFLHVFLFRLQHWISPLSQLVAELVLGKIWPSVVFTGVPETLANHWLPTGSIPPRVFYNRGVAVFSHVALHNFPCFQEGHIPLVFHLNYFLFFFVSIARSCVSRMLLSAVCTCNFFQAIFLHMVQVLFTTCLSSSKSFSMVSIFLAFEAPQGSWMYFSTLSRQ